MNSVSIKLSQFSLSALILSMMVTLTLTAYGQISPVSFSENEWVRPLDELKAYRERPLFSSVRKPPLGPIVDTPTLVPEVTEQTFDGVLVGILSSNIDGLVLIKDIISDKVTRVSLHGNYKDWTLISINRRDVTFKSGDTTTTLSLDMILRPNTARTQRDKLPTQAE